MMLKYKLRRISKSKLIIWSTLLLLFFVSMGSIVNYYASSVDIINSTVSKIDGEIVYVNDFASDLNYYTSLNYTEITDRDNLPEYHDKYNKDTLVAVQLTYDGHDINNDELYGWVSVNEKQTKYVYYKYYPIVDGKITIELIDNPYSARPTNYGFNGWVCDTTNSSTIPCDDFTFSYDDDYYIRYLTIPAPEADSEGNKKLILNLKASWVKADVESFTTSNKPTAAKINKELNDSKMISCYSNGANICFDKKEENPIENLTMDGYYYKIDTLDEFDPLSKNLYYDVNGISCSTTTCTVSKGIYKLIQNSDIYSKPYFKDENESIVLKNDIDLKKYYYLVTRDTNIVELNFDGETVFPDLFKSSLGTPATKDFTLTSCHSKNCENYKPIMTFNNKFAQINSDIVLENLTFDSKSSDIVYEVHKNDNDVLYANNYNLKIGRNIKSISENKFTMGEVVAGYTSANKNKTKNKIIVESGHYNSIVSGSAVSSTSTIFTNFNTISQLGSDYDRANEFDNSKLVVEFAVTSNYSGAYKNSTTIPSSQEIIKSGIYGNRIYEKGIDASPTSYRYGIYVGGSSAGASTSLRTLKIEGGKIYNVNGGVDLSSEVQEQNVVGIYMLGGVVENLVGGGAIDETYGNRIVSITGGNVRNSVAGGSNSSTGTSDSAGPLFGKTLVYIGGSARIGGRSDDDKIYGISKVGSVYGAGLGNVDDSKLGGVSSSSVIVNGGEIFGDVYGGGNYGAVGSYSKYNFSTTTNIKIIDGNINGNVFGAANNNGFSKVGYKDDSKILIDISGGNIDSGVYGGANSNGSVYGSIEIDITGGNIKESVYGAGFGKNTTAIGNITINYNNPDERLDSIYGGSSFGKVGSESFSDQRYTTIINVNGGSISEIYGGSEGSENEDIVPNVYGNSIINIDGGNITTVFGGNNVRGFVTLGTEVNVENGNIDTVYGGSHGSNASATDTKVNVTGGTVTTIYGGGKAAPADSSTIIIDDSAIVDNVFGGSDESGTVGETKVIAIGGEVKCNVYGGGQAAPVNKSNVELSGTNFTYQVNEDSKAEESLCGNIFGGGKAANVTESYVIINGGTVLNVYGGSNESGEVFSTRIDVNSGSIVNVFGGGNRAPVLESTIVNMYDGSVNNVYGGGNKSYIGKALTKVTGELLENTDNNVIDYVEGKTEVNIAGGNINKNVYGSGNTSFVYGNTYLNIGASALKDDNIDVVKNITIGGSVYGGSETNPVENDTYDYGSIGVSGASFINVDGREYVENGLVTLHINGSIYGSGNNSNTSKTKTLYISNYGNENSLVSSQSIQRFDNVYIKDSSLELKGDKDRQTGKGTPFSLIRIDNLYLLGSESEDELTGTNIYIKSGSTYLKQWFSGSLVDGVFVPQETIEVGDSLVNKYSNNKLYMYTNKLLSVSKTEVPDRTTAVGPGKINGMTFLGMYSVVDDNYFKGIYDDFEEGEIVLESQINEINSSDYTYVFGARSQDYQDQIKTNGFYTNVSRFSSVEDSYIVHQEYVDVTPHNNATNYYEWKIGDVPATIDIPLVATRYSVEGVATESLYLDALKEQIGEDKFSWRDATMEIYSVNTNEFKAETPNVKQAYNLYLVDKSKIDTNNFNDLDNDGILDSNQYFSLSIGTTSNGWLDNYKTNIYNNGYTIDNNIYGEDFCVDGNGGDCVGDKIYLYDSTQNDRSLTFWLHHSKNLDFDVIDEDPITKIKSANLGTIVISTRFTNPHADPTDAKGSVLVSINVQVSMREGDTDAYGSSISPGKKYEVFENVPTAITTDSSFSIYQSLYLDLKAEKLGNTQGEMWSVEEVYKSGNYRALRSSYNFPVGTRITMLDLVDKRQYFFDVDGSNHKLTEEIYQYKLSEFYAMGNDDKKEPYDDDMRGKDSEKYYFHDSSYNIEIGSEEFIFIVDFSNVSCEEHRLQNENEYYFSMVLASSDDNVILKTKDAPETTMNYTLFSYTDVELKTTGGFITEQNQKSDKVSIYSKQNVNLQLDTSVLVFNNGLKSKATTTIFDGYKLGANIKISRAKIDEQGNPIMEDGNIVYESIPEDDNLLGLVLSVNGESFYPQKDHTIRVKLAGKVTGLTSLINFDFSSSNLKPGQYKIDVETFASYDGLYYGDSDVSISTYELTLLNDEYGLDVKVDNPIQMTHDVNSGQDKNGNNVITYSIQSKNGLTEPKLKVSLQRKVDEAYSLEYEEKELSNIASSWAFNNSCDTDSCYILVLNNNLTIENSIFTLTLKNGPTEEEKNNPSSSLWKSGTYRVVFTLYDGEVPMGSVYEYLIIRDLGIEENERSES